MPVTTACVYGVGAIGGYLAARLALGGVSSPRSPLDMSTFSESELRAGVEATQDRNTYVTVHAYAPATVQRAISPELDQIEESLNTLRMPLAHADAFYVLREHVGFVRAHLSEAHLGRE